MNLKRTFLYTGYLIAGTALLSLTTVLESCKHKTAASYKLTGDTIADGKYLVQQYCTNCHALVPADALTKDVWRMHALPSMAAYLKISTYGSEFFKKETDTGGISLQNWQAIVDYYNKIAPVELKAAKAPVSPVNDWAGFTLKKPEEAANVAFTTMVAANPASGKIYTSDLMTATLTEWGSNLKPKAIASLPSAAVNMQFDGNKAILSCIGRIDRVDFPNGRIESVDLTKADQQSADIVADMPRPVQTLSADFDKDGQPELVICGQGFTKGGVYLVKTDAAGKAKEQHTIADRTGAVQAVSQDFNKDGWPDLMVLYGIGNEGLTLYLNDKKGGFLSKDLLKFPPVYGSTSFQLVDMDHDGNLDLIYTCGYNYGDSRIMKPYHGLYIYKNTGDFSFKQQWFYPINGATKAIAADFDGDGDMDIMTSAFFADLKNNPAEELLYFEQDKPSQFKPHAIPANQYGRWMTMDLADINKDGKQDVILGNYGSGFIIQPNFTPTWNERVPFVVLYNSSKIIACKKHVAPR